MSESDPKISAVEKFARNVTDRQGLGFLLIQNARDELGSKVTEDAVERRATRLLLECLLQVGISPETELERREQLFQILRGDEISDSVIRVCVNYILSQMVIQPKGALAECFSISPCVRRLAKMKTERKMPPNSRFARNVWSRRLTGMDEDGSPLWAEWREAADGLFYCELTESQISAANIAPEAACIEPGHIVVLGAIEIKSYRGISRKKLNEQLDKHLARLSAGIQFRDWSGKDVLREISPEAIWFGAFAESKLSLLHGGARSFSLSHYGKKKTLRVSWLHPLMRELNRLSIGPVSTSARNDKKFDINVPFSEAELEELGSAMAYYTLGALADQPQVDLSGAEWSHNLQTALEKQSEETLSSRRQARRNKILQQLR